MTDYKRILQSGLLKKSIINGDYSTSDTLLQQGADPNIEIDGVTAFHVAVGVDLATEQFAKLLLQNGADPNIRTSEGLTPLHVAIIYDKCDVVKLLLQNGANPLITDQDGQDCASQSECQACRTLIQYHLQQEQEDEEEEINEADLLEIISISSCDENTLISASPVMSNIGANTPVFSPPTPTLKETTNNASPRDILLKRKTRRIHSNYTEKWLNQHHLIQPLFDEYDPCQHFLDITSPDHPMLIRKDQGDTMLSVTMLSTPSPEAHFGLNLRLPSECTEASFHTCESDSPVPFENCQDQAFAADVGDYCRGEANFTDSGSSTSESTTSDQLLNKEQRMKCDTDSFVPSEYDPDDLSLNLSLSSSEKDRSKKKNTRRSSGKVRADRSLQFDKLNMSSSSDAKNIICQNLGKRLEELCVSSGEKKLQKRLSEPVLRSVFTSDESDADDASQSRYAIRTGAPDRQASDKSVKLGTVLTPGGTNRRASDVSSISGSSQVSNDKGPKTSTRNATQEFDLDFPSFSTIHSKESGVNRKGSSASDASTTVLYWEENANQNNNRTVCSNQNTTLVSIIVTEDIRQLSDSALYHELQDLGEYPGPITPATRGLYQTRLAHIRSNPQVVEQNKSIAEEVKVFSSELWQALCGRLDISALQELEDAMCQPFSKPDPARHWREGTEKSSFNYLLLDPRITKNLPNRVKVIGTDEAFEIFVKAIFYVGKGKRSRPYSHFKEAIKHINNPVKQPSEKVGQILEVWNEGLGVVSLHIYQNVIPVEAYTREACMIDSIGINLLTNIKLGDYYGIAPAWPSKKRRLLGVRLLQKAFRIFLSEGERQIRPTDLKP